MGRSLVVLVLLAGAASAQENDARARCDAGDAAACRQAATRAARIRRLSLANELRQRANALEAQAQVQARAASLADLAAFDGETPEARDERVENLERLLSVPLVEAEVGDAPGDTAPPAPPRTPLAGAPMEAARSSSSWPRPGAPALSSRFGVVTLAGAEIVTPLRFGSTVTEARLGVGPRFSLIPRSLEAHQVLPAASLVLGATVNGLRQAFLAEARLELVVASSPSITQATFALYGLAGVEASGHVDPYVGLGLGWNWLPKKLAWASVPVIVGTGLGLLMLTLGPGALPYLLAGALLGVAFDGLVFAGHIELRYFPGSSPIGGPREQPLGPTEYPSGLAILSAWARSRLSD